MIDSKALSNVIFNRDLSQRKVAHHLGMTEKTFYSKMKKGVFDSDEIEEMIKFISDNIEKPLDAETVARRFSLSKLRHATSDRITTNKQPTKFYTRKELKNFEN